MRTRTLLYSGLATMAVSLVMAGSAMAAASVTPAGPFLATASNLKIVFPAHGPTSESTITCKSTTFSGLVHAPEGGKTLVTGLEPPIVKECAVRNWIPNGTAYITATAPIEQFQFNVQAPNPGIIIGVGPFRLHVRTEQPLGLNCEFEINGTLQEHIKTGYPPFVLSELPVRGELLSGVKTEGECRRLFGETYAVTTATLTLNHALTVS